MSRPPVLPLDVPSQGLTPQALRNTYNVTPLFNAGYTGKGTTIVIFAFDGFDQADLDTFADLHGLPRFTPTVVGGELDEPRGETTMDLEASHAIAPDARKVVINARPTVEGDGAYEKIGQMLESADREFPGAVWSFSIGWGCDKLITAADLAPVRSALAAAHTRGTTAFNASGDLAGLECKGGSDWSSPPGADDIGLDSVASLPEMTDVGGTTLSTDADGRWLAEQAWFDVPLSLGTGGGVSAIFDRPQWQRAVMPDQDPGRRLTPDISAVADPFTGLRIVFDQRQLVGGGTSQSAPVWAGIAAVMNQYLLANGGRALGDLNPVLYRIAAGAPLPAFRDVTLGGNAVADAGPGYDLATGLGTPDVDNLVRNVLVLQGVRS
jgi:kumamolisin